MSYRDCRLQLIKRFMKLDKNVFNYRRDFYMMLGRGTAIPIIVFCAWIFEYGLEVHFDVKQSKWWAIACFFSFWLSIILKTSRANVRNVQILLLSLLLFEVLNVVSLPFLQASMQIVYTNFKRDARIQRSRLLLLESPLANVMSNPAVQK